MELYQKFRKYFVFTLIIGILFSILIGIIVTNYTSKFLKNNVIEQKVKHEQDEMIIPIIQSVRNKLFKKFQQTIYTLETIADYYDNSMKQENTLNETFINNRMINSVIFNKKFPEIYDDLLSGGKSLLDYGVWHIDDEIGDLNSYRLKHNDTKYEILVNQLTSIAKITKIIRTFYELSKTHNEINIYISSNKTNLFYIYPLDYNSTNNDFNYLVNYSNSYYDFHIRPWYENTVKLNSDAKEWVFITDPYSFVESDIGLTVCYRMKDNSDKVPDFLYICSDLKINDLITNFDDLNRKAGGYFYVMPINSSTPMYYPGMNMSAKNFLEIQRYEYSNNLAYYVEEGLEFQKDTISKMNIEVKNLLNSTDFKNNLTVNDGTYTINKNQKRFSVYPVRLFINPNEPYTSVHVLSIIYVSPGSIKGSITNFDFSNKMIILIIIFAVLGVVLIIVMFFL